MAYDIQHRKETGRLGGIKTGKISQDKRNERIKNYSLNPKHCLNCNSLLSFDDSKSKKFCNRSCAAKLNNSNRSIESRKRQGKKLSETMSCSAYQQPKRKHTGPGSIKKSSRVSFVNCKVCNTLYTQQGWGKPRFTTCSPECARLASMRRNLQKKYVGPNGNIKLESSWEISLAEWLDSEKVNWVRPQHLCWIDSSGKHRKYFPDFYLPDFGIYLDPKNSYHASLQQEKLQYIQSRYILIYGTVEDIKQELIFYWS